jgi:imidazole glycerol-phosphate synthase subunit HisH
MSEIKNLNKIKVGILDLRTNNLFSIYHGLKKVNYKVSIIDEKSKKFNYDLIILPGVGSFKAAMRFIKKNRIDEKLFDHAIIKKKYLYGICLGMQLLFSSSKEFGFTKGMNFINGEVVKLSSQHNYPVPHMGWSKIKIKNKKENFIKQINFNGMYYFVHSYYCKPKNTENIISLTTYGNNEFCSAVRKNNILGTQFHPEKSSLYGLNLLKNLGKLIS